jgi:hypothetical protein
MTMRTARDATDAELLDIIAQADAVFAQGLRLDPTDAIVVAAVRMEARERGLIEGYLER